MKHNLNFGSKSMLTTTSAEQKKKEKWKFQLIHS